MSAAMGYAAALRAVFERDLRVFLSHRLRSVTQLLGLMFTLATFYYVSRLVRVEQFSSADAYFAFVVAGLLILNVLHAAVTVPDVIRQELVAGTFERFLLSPLGAVGGVWAMMAFPIAFACVVAVVGFLLASVIFGLPVEWSTAPLALPVALLGALAFAALGALAAAVVIVFKQAFGLTWVIAFLALTSGVYFPVVLLPDWLEIVSKVQPFTPAIDLLRHLLIGTDSAGEAGLALVKLAGFVAVLAPLSVLALHAAVRVARKRGNILEY